MVLFINVEKLLFGICNKNLYKIICIKKKLEMMKKRYVKEIFCKHGKGKYSIDVYLVFFMQMSEK